MTDSPRFFSIPNLVAQQVTPVNPWDFQPQVPDNVLTTKELFQSWLSQPSARHCLYSAVEGVVPGLRISTNNEPHAVHALIADFDTTISDELIERVKTNCPGEFKPNWVQRTYSGGARLIWVFQNPALVHTAEFAEAFLAVAVKKLKVKKFLPGLDDAVTRPNMYYEVGTKWQQLEARPVPADFIWSWLYEAGNTVKWANLENPVVPLEDLAAEVANRFPGRWQGEFALGSSGVRFWDAAADNPRGCTVRLTGMQCFTGPTAFMSWGAIFGSAFIEKYKSETLGAIMSGTWYDGKYYWRRSEGGDWHAWAKDDFKIHLKVRYGLNSNRVPGRKSSELEEVIDNVHVQKRIHAALPFVHFPDGIMEIDGSKYLNISTVRCLPPSEKGSISGWGDKFPWLAEFFDNFFCTKSQKEHFLSWLRHAYQHGLELSPSPGQAVVIAGGVNRGKTLLSTIIVSQMLGGHADASSFFLGEEKFTSHILSKPLMTIDDTAPASDRLRHTRYSAMLKKVVANQSHTFEKKFMNAGRVRWVGRVMITCNADPESIRILPSLDMSNTEKLSLFRCGNWKDNPIKFPPQSELENTIRQELPFFCRWLLDWDEFGKFRGTSRMGVKAFHDHQMFDAAIQTGAAYSFFEVLQIFLKEYKEATGETSWTGNATKLVSAINMNDALKPLMTKTAPVSVAMYLGQLKSRGFAITQTRKSASREWHIPVDLTEERVNEDYEVREDSEVDIEAPAGESKGGDADSI